MITFCNTKLLFTFSELLTSVKNIQITFFIESSSNETCFTNGASPSLFLKRGHTAFIHCGFCPQMIRINRISVNFVSLREKHVNFSVVLRKIAEIT